MTVASRRHIKSPIMRGIDTKDASLALYLPLWYQYSDMTGSTIYSYDKNRISCTVTGATWGYRGRTFDGDDYIEATATELDFLSDFTILMWLYPTTLLGASRLIFCRGDYRLDGYRLYLSAAGGVYIETNQAGADQTSNTAVGKVVINKWQLVGVTRAGAVGKLWVDVVNQTSSSASHVNPLTSARTLKLGIADDLLTAPYIGIMGEVAAWSRDLGLAGISQYRQATKWRFV